MFLALYHVRLTKAVRDKHGKGLAVEKAKF